MLRQIYTKKGIEFNLNSKVVKVEGNKVVYEKDGASHEVVGDKILLSVGRRPVTKGFGLENLNIELEHNGKKVENKMRTNYPGVFAVGDMTCFTLLYHIVRILSLVVVHS